MNNKTKKLTTIGMLCAIAYVAAAVGRIPLVLFLKYDPKDIIIAIGGLFCGWGCMVFVMLLWNYLITPFYMGYPREAVAELLIPAFLPFNLIKGGLNAGITMILYKPVVTALRRSHLIDTTQMTEKVN